MATFAQDSDLLEYEPDIKNYGIQDFSDLHSKTYDDIVRLLNIKWWKTTQMGSYDISVIGQVNRLDENKLNANQFTRAAVYHVLGEYIYPRLSTFEPDGDSFREKMMYYKGKFADEFDYILQVGVDYDLNSDGTISDSEQQPFYFNRLIR